MGWQSGRPVLGAQWVAAGRQSPEGSDRVISCLAIELVCARLPDHDSLRRAALDCVITWTTWTRKFARSKVPSESTMSIERRAPSVTHPAA
jgi:hypothetical protein